MRRPGIEPGSTAWKAAMLTTIPPTLYERNALVLVRNWVSSLAPFQSPIGNGFCTLVLNWECFLQEATFSLLVRFEIRVN